MTSCKTQKSAFIDWLTSVYEKSDGDRLAESSIANYSTILSGRLTKIARRLGIVQDGDSLYNIQSPRELQITVFSQDAEYNQYNETDHKAPENALKRYLEFLKYSNKNPVNQKRDTPTSQTIQPPKGTEIPRYAGPNTFCRLPELRDLQTQNRPCDVALLGIPFDAGTSYRPGARFGPQAIRQASRHLRTNFHPAYDTEPYQTLQVADAGDVSCNPFNIPEAITQIETAAKHLFTQTNHIISLGGDHTIALPLLRAVNHHLSESVALVHFDAHLDTWDTYFGAPYTHGTPFRRAAEEKLFDDATSMHVGIRGPLYSRQDLIQDAEFGFKVIHCDELHQHGASHVADRIRKRIGKKPLYLSIDIDVLDPSNAPGTGTPEIGGISSRELLTILRELKGVNLIAADIVEVAPAYDHAELTSLAAATIAFEMINLLAYNHKP